MERETARGRGAAGDDADGRRGRRRATPMGDDGLTNDGDSCVRLCEIQASEAAAQRCESCEYDCGGGLHGCFADLLVLLGYWAKD